MGYHSHQAWQSEKRQLKLEKKIRISPISLQITEITAETQGGIKEMKIKNKTFKPVYERSWKI